MADEDVVEAIRELWRSGATPAIISIKTLQVGNRAHQDPIEFVDNLITAAGETGVKFFQGYLGGGTKRKEEEPTQSTDYVRFYSSLEFSEYLDIPKAAIVLLVDLRSPFNPLAGQAVWVREGYEMTRAQTGASKVKVQSQFLGGEVAAGAGASLPEADAGERGGYSYPLRCGYSYPLRCGYSYPLRCQG